MSLQINSKAAAQRHAGKTAVTKAVALVCLLSTPLFSSGVRYIGVGDRDLTPERAAELNLNDPLGAEIVTVAPGSPAGKAGLKEHDVIVSIDNQPVTSASQLGLYVQQFPAGRKVEVGVIRHGEAITTLVQIASRRVSAGPTPSVQPKAATPPAQPSMAENCAKGAGNALAATAIVTAIGCLVDLFVSGGALCTAYVSTAAANAPTAAAAGCAVVVVSKTDTGASAGVSAAPHIQLDQ